MQIQRIVLTSRALFLSLCLAVLCGVPHISAGDRDIKVQKQNPMGSPKSMAILIGINRYEARTCSDLRYCGNDVRALATVLRESGQFDTIQLFHDDAKDTALRPTAANLRRELQALLRRADKEGYGRVVIHFSGHGESLNTAQGQKLYLIPGDFDPNDVAATSVAISDLKQWLNACRRVPVKLLFLDCCYAGQTRDSGTPSASPETLALAMRSCRGLLTMASCKKNEKSLEWNKHRHGLFTFWLCEGLRGGADLDRDGVIGSDELYRYVYEQVLRTSTIDLHRVQRVVLRPGDDWQGVAPVLRTARRYSSSHTTKPRKHGSQWRTLVERVVQKLKPAFEKNKVSSVVIGNFASAWNLSNATAGAGIENLLAETLAREGIAPADGADFGLMGSYAVQVRDKGEYKSSVLSLTVELKNVDQDVLAKVTETFDPTGAFWERYESPKKPGPTRRQPQDPDGAGGTCVAIGATVALPTTTESGFDGRAEVLSQAMSAKKQQYFVRNKTEILADPESPYAMEILVEGEALRPDPNRSKTQAFVRLAPEVKYKIRVWNRSPHDVAVGAYIDGLSAFTFSEQKTYRHFIIPAGKSTVIPGWYLNNQRSAAFLVKKYGEGRMAASKNPRDVGTITLTFAAAWRVDGPMPKDEELLGKVRRGGLETDLGPPEPVQYETVKRHIGMVRAAISVRYDR